MDQRPPDIVVIAGGASVAPSALADIDSSAAFVVAADSGLDHAVALGWAADVDVVVGDFDSVTHAALDAAAEAGADVRPFSPDKDFTDLELALNVALEHADRIAERESAPMRVLVLCIDGGRLDHELANLALLADSRYQRLDISWRSNRAHGRAVHHAANLDAPVGATVSVLPVLGPAVVTLDGFHWPLDRRLIEPGSTLGVSNLVTTVSPRVEVHDGVVLVIIPTNPVNQENS